MSTQILTGITVVDLTTGLAGPVATQLLAEAGADVVKVETSSGDPVRESQPVAFETWNRSKRGLVVDLADQAGRDRLGVLLEGADILVHELPPSRAVALGLDDASLARRFPQLIAASVLGYSVTHPDAERAAHEILVQARSGAMDEQLSHRPGPCFVRFPLASWPTAYLAAVGILTRLIVRHRTGRAGPVHTSLQQGLLSMLAMLWNRADSPSTHMSMKIPLPKAMPFVLMTLFRCQDGQWLQTLGGFMENPLVLETCAMLGEEPPDVPFGSLPSGADIALWRRLFLTRPADEWLEAFRAGDVPAELVQELGAVFSDPQVLVNGYTVDVVHPTYGRIRQAAAPFRTDPPSEVRGPAPRLGEDSLPRWAPRTRRPSQDDQHVSGVNRPLMGLKVLDLGSYLAGPFAPMLLADLGADVVKVEATTGEKMRQHEILFIGAQRGKRSIAIDLARPEAADVLKRLVSWADIVHHNMRGPAALSLGVDELSLRAINPDVIFCHVSSYGPMGLKADWPGYDPTAQAASGWMLAGAGEGNPPLWHRFGMMDHQAALASLVPTLLALYQRDLTGRASSVTSSLVAAATMTNSETHLCLDTGEVPDVPAVDRDLTGMGPYYRVYAVGHRQIAVAATTRREQAAFRRVVGIDDGLSDADKLSMRVAEALGDEDPDTVLEALDSAGVPAELVRLDQEGPFLLDEVNRAANLSVTYHHQQYGMLVQPGAFWSFGDLDLRLDRPPPTLGEHTLEVLAELGLGAGEIAALVDAEVIVGPELAR